MVTGSSPSCNLCKIKQTMVLTVLHCVASVTCVERSRPLSPVIDPAQIRRYVYCDVVRAIDISPHVDISGVQVCGKSLFRCSKRSVVGWRARILDQTRHAVVLLDLILQLFLSHPHPNPHITSRPGEVLYDFITCQPLSVSPAQCLPKPHPHFPFLRCTSFPCSHLFNIFYALTSIDRLERACT